MSLQLLGGSRVGVKITVSGTQRIGVKTVLCELGQVT